MSVDTKSVAAGVDAAKSAIPKRGVQIGTLLSLTLVGLLALMWILLAVSTKSFWTYNNITNLFRQGAMIAILSIGETFVIITAGIDLSVGAVVGFTSVIIALFLTNGFPIWAAILITNGATISITNDTFTGFSRGDFLGVPNLFWMVIVVAVPGYIFLHQSRFGRYLFAIGSNAEAARLSGVNTIRMIYIAYTLSGVCAAFVGVLLAMRIGIRNATQAEVWELQAIASSVIGGTSLFGAVGSVHGPLLGSFILTTINNGANLLNVNAFWQRIITGVLIIVIVYFDGLRRKKR